MPVSSRVSRSESLRSEFSDQSKRVSFHRSVDIKRIPKISEQQKSPPPPPSPQINDKELLIREAQEVLKSIDRVQCSVGGDLRTSTANRSTKPPDNSTRTIFTNRNSSRSSSRGNSVDRIIDTKKSNGFLRSSPSRVIRENSVARDSRANSVTRSNNNTTTKKPPINKSNHVISSSSSSSNSKSNTAPAETNNKTVINRVSGTLKRVKSAVNKKKVKEETVTEKEVEKDKDTAPHTQQQQQQQRELKNKEKPSRQSPPKFRDEENSSMTRNPRVSSIVDKLSNMKTSPPPFHYDSQPFSYISGRPKLSSPKEVIYAQVVVGDKDKRTVHRSVASGRGYVPNGSNGPVTSSYNNDDYENDFLVESNGNKMNGVGGSGRYEYTESRHRGGGGGGGVDLISNNDSDYLDDYLKNAKPRANVTTVLLNNVDDEDFTVEKSHFRFRSVSPKDMDYHHHQNHSSSYNNGFSYGSLGRYSNNNTGGSNRQVSNDVGNNEDNDFFSYRRENYDDEYSYNNNGNGTKTTTSGYYNNNTKNTTYFGDFYDYRENEGKHNKISSFDAEDSSFKLDAKIDKWREADTTRYNDEVDGYDDDSREYKDKYEDYYAGERENKYNSSKKYTAEDAIFQSASESNKEKYERHDNKIKETQKAAKIEKEITSTKLVKEFEKTRENSLPSAKMVNNVKKENKGFLSTLTRKEKFPFFTFSKKKNNLDKEIEEVERRRDGEYHNWSSGDDLYKEETVKTEDTSGGDYRKNLAMRSSTLNRPTKVKDEEIGSKSLDRRFKTPKIVITPNTPAVGDNKPPSFRVKENNNLRYFGDTDCEDIKTAPTPQWPNNNSSESENGSRMSGSQRSVYLHAGIVADIPPTGLQRRTMSRDELSNHSGAQKQTRHLARSMSVLAPWRPRHYREKYEVHYSNGGRPPKPPRSPTRKSPNRASSSDSLLKIDEEKETTMSNNKKAMSVGRSKSMPKDSRLASWLRRKYKR